MPTIGPSRCQMNWRFTDTGLWRSFLSLMAYADQKMSTRRLSAVVAVAILHVALTFALISGLAVEVVRTVQEDLNVFDVEDEPPPPPEEELPPPPPEIPIPPPPVVVTQPPPVVIRRPTMAPRPFRPEPPRPRPRLHLRRASHSLHSRAVIRDAGLRMPTIRRPRSRPTSRERRVSV